MQLPALGSQKGMYNIQHPETKDISCRRRGSPTPNPTAASNRFHAVVKHSSRLW